MPHTALKKGILGPPLGGPMTTFLSEHRTSNEHEILASSRRTLPTQTIMASTSSSTSTNANLHPASPANVIKLVCTDTPTVIHTSASSGPNYTTASTVRTITKLYEHSLMTVRAPTTVLSQKLYPRQQMRPWSTKSAHAQTGST